MLYPGNEKARQCSFFKRSNAESLKSSNGTPVMECSMTLKVAGKAEKRE